MKRNFSYLFTCILLVSCSESKNSSEKPLAQTSEGFKHETVDEYNARKKSEVLNKNEQKANKNNKLPAQQKPGEWYEGGTLHQSKIAEWKKATEANKLATCADFIAKARKIANMNDLLAKSVGLRACITEATKGLPSTDNEKVSDVAVLCFIQLGY
jgi:hypothetical protein